MSTPPSSPVTFWREIASVCRVFVNVPEHGEPSPVTVAPLDELLRRVAIAVRDTCAKIGYDDHIGRINVDGIIARVKRESAPAEEPPAYPYGIRLPKVTEPSAANCPRCFPDRPVREGATYSFCQQHEQPAESAPAEEPVELAARFHAIYERLAPSFGYDTRTDTRKFNPASVNGRLMTAVCEEILGVTKVQPCSELEPCPLHPRVWPTEQPAESAPTSEPGTSELCAGCHNPMRLRPGSCTSVLHSELAFAAAEARGRLAGLQEAEHELLRLATAFHGGAGDFTRRETYQFAANSIRALIEKTTRGGHDADAAK